MNKFKVGDLVKRIADPAFDYRYMVSGEVYTVTGLPEDDYDSIEVNNLTERWDYARFELYQSPVVEQSPSELEEAYAHIETLQEALEDAAKEIFSLKHQLIAKAADTCLGIEKKESQFKAISEMTLEDWELAKEEGWVFEMNNGNLVFVDGIMRIYTSDDYPVEFAYVDGQAHAGITTLEGHYYKGEPEYPESIKCRIN